MTSCRSRPVTPASSSESARVESGWRITDLGSAMARAVHRVTPASSRGSQVAAADRLGEQPRLAHRVGHDLQAVETAHEHPGAEGLEVERPDVDPPPHGRVGRVEHLEAAVAAEAVDDVGAHTASDRVAGLQHDDLAAELRQPSCAAKPGQTCAHDDDVSIHERITSLLEWAPAAA